MADSLCGPSNAMQNLQKQTTQDRTLQQDRLISRHAPVHGFRSSGPNAGVLDPEFEAFQAAQAHFSGTEQQHAFNQQAAFLASQQGGQVHHGSGDWASDFAQMNLSGPSAPHLRAQSQALVQQHGRGWLAEYAGKQAQFSQPPNQQGPMQYNPRFQGQSGLGVWSSQYNIPPGFQNQQHQNQAQAPAQASSDEVFDDEAFARAFDEAEAFSRPLADWELELDQAVLDYERSKEEAALDARAHAALDREEAEAAGEIPFLESPADDEEITQRIGADLIINPITDLPREQRHLISRAEEHDMMARTAASMLDSVRHNTTEKFQNSQFLKLMQQFRDRQVIIQDNKIVDKNEAAGASGSGSSAAAAGAGAGTGGESPVLKEVEVVSS